MSESSMLLAMRISGLNSKLDGEILRHSASLTWEDNQRPDKELWFKIADADKLFHLDPNALLIACFPMAVASGEKRIALDGPVSPFLLDRLTELHGWWRQWGYTKKSMPTVEAPLAKPKPSKGWTSACLLSGGVDSLHMLQNNLKAFAKGNPHRITKAILVTGFDVDINEAQEKAAYDLATDCLEKVTSDVGVKLIRVETNLRKIEPHIDFWLKFFHGAVLGVVSHAAINGPAVSRVASTLDIPNVFPWGSHPLTDSCFSTERLSIIHEGVTFSRLDKVRDLVKWPVALENVRVCSTIIPGYLNCGLCEKCVRTKLEIAAVGVEIPSTFKDRKLTGSQLPAMRNKYQMSCYREAIEPLRKMGHGTLASAIRLKIFTSPALNFVKTKDAEWFDGRIIRSIRSVKPSAWHRSRLG